MAFSRFIWRRLLRRRRRATASSSPPPPSPSPARLRRGHPGRTSVAAAAAFPFKERCTQAPAGAEEGEEGAVEEVAVAEEEAAGGQLRTHGLSGPTHVNARVWAASMWPHSCKAAAVAAVAAVAEEKACAKQEWPETAGGLLRTHSLGPPTRKGARAWAAGVWQRSRWVRRTTSVAAAAVAIAAAAAVASAASNSAAAPSTSDDTKTTANKPSHSGTGDSSSSRAERRGRGSPREVATAEPRLRVDIRRRGAVVVFDASMTVPRARAAAPPGGA